MHSGVGVHVGLCVRRHACVMRSLRAFVDRACMVFWARLHTPLASSASYLVQSTPCARSSRQERPREHARGRACIEDAYLREEPRKDDCTHIGRPFRRCYNWRIKCDHNPLGLASASAQPTDSETVSERKVCEAFTRRESHHREGAHPSCHCTRPHCPRASSLPANGKGQPGSSGPIDLVTYRVFKIKNT